MHIEHGCAQHAVDQQRVGEQSVRPQQQWVDATADQQHCHANADAARKGAVLPIVQQRHHGQCNGGHHQRRQQTDGQRHHQGAHTDGESLARLKANACQAVERDGHAGQARHLRVQLMRAQQQTERADQQCHRDAAGAFVKQFVGGLVQIKYCHQHERATRQPCAVVRGQGKGKNSCAQCRHPVVKRRVIGVDRAGDVRKQPAIGAGEHGMHNAHGYGLVRFPWVVADEAGHEPRKTNDDKQGGLDG